VAARLGRAFPGIREGLQVASGRLFATALVAALLVAHAAFAAPIVGGSASTIPQGEFMIDSWTIWRNYEREFDEGLYDDGQGGWKDLRFNSALSHTSFVPRLCYGATEWLTIRVALPLEDRYSNFPDNGGIDTNTGFGDIVIDPKIQLYRGTSGYPRVALLTGIRLPTGDTDGVDGSGRLALSDGSTDYLVGAAVTHDLGPATAHAYMTYWLNGEKENGVDAKDVWIGCASLETPLNDSWSLLWEFKGYWGEDPSAFYRTYACPGVLWNGERLTLGVSSMISFVSHGDDLGAFDYNWAPYARVYYRFF
jgi:hypothetical protein